MVRASAPSPSRIRPGDADGLAHPGRARRPGCGPVELTGEERGSRDAGRGHLSASMSSRTNTGWLGAMRWTSDSSESAVTPSKNTPTSIFQRPGRPAGRATSRRRATRGRSAPRRRRPRTSASRPPSARTFRTHWPSPRGDTRYWRPSSSSRLTGVRRGTTAGAPRDLQDPAPPHADPGPHHHGHERVHDLPGEHPRLAVVHGLVGLVHGCLLSVGPDVRLTLLAIMAYVVSLVNPRPAGHRSRRRRSSRPACG